MAIHQDSQTQRNLDNRSNYFDRMPQPTQPSQPCQPSPSALAVKERDDGRTQPWKAFMHVTHTADSPIGLGFNVRLLGQRVNAHVG